MRCVVLVHKGIEDIAADEIFLLSGSRPSASDSCLVFDLKGYEEICRLAYSCQSARRLCLALGEADVSGIGDMKKLAAGIDYSFWLRKGVSFSFRHISEDCRGLERAEIEAGLGGAVKDAAGAEVNLSSPDIPVVSIISSGRMFICIDFSGFELSKREYNVFGVSKSLKGDVAYAVAMLSGLDGGCGAFLDPSSGSGAISIEAALFCSGKSPHFYSKDKFSFLNFKLPGINFKEIFSEADKEHKAPKQKIYATDPHFSSLKNSKNNSRIMGVERLINFSRNDFRWLGLKFRQNSISLVASHLVFPQSERRRVKKALEELFSQLSGIMPPGAKAAFICYDRAVKEAASKNSFSLSQERTIMQGKAGLPTYIFERGRHQ